MSNQYAAHAMRVLLRNTQTGLFYAGQEKWTEKDTDALDFHETDAAMDAAWETKLQGVEVLMRFDEPFLEIPLQIAGFGK